MLSCLSCVRRFVTLWTSARQAPISMGFSRNPGVGCHAFLQGIFPTQGLDPCFLWLLHRRQILYLLTHQGSPHLVILDEKNSYKVWILIVSAQP